MHGAKEQHAIEPQSESVTHGGEYVGLERGAHERIAALEKEVRELRQVKAEMDSLKRRLAHLSRRLDRLPSSLFAPENPGGMESYRS